ncbi:MAG: DUF177 domain-containing protein [Burkholderiaceae bacterium]|nr:DUF177 domain-containing protein [Burkholderiaceae bacterium]
MHALSIDTFEFSRLKERREGETAVAEFTRLSEEVAEPSGTVVWAVEGSTNALGHPQLTLSVKVAVKLMCQRCLTPFAYEIESESVLALAKDDEAADELEARLDDESIDVIVGSKNMNVLELIEDEVLLELPPSPKHPVCPDQVGQDTEAMVSAKRVSPFEVLKNKQ